MVGGCIKNMQDIYKIFIVQGNYKSFQQLATAAHHVGESVERTGMNRSLREASRRYNITPYNEPQRDRRPHEERGHDNYSQRSPYKGFDTRRLGQVNAASSSQGGRGGRWRATPDDVPDYPCGLDQVKTALNEWVRRETLQLPPVAQEPSAEDKQHPRYCIWHRRVGHPWSDCWHLKRLIHDKWTSGELIVNKNGVQQQPLPHHEQHRANVISAPETLEDSIPLEVQTGSTWGNFEHQVMIEDEEAVQAIIRKN